MTVIRKATLADISQLSILFDAYRVFYEMDSNISEAELFLTERITNEESIVFVALDSSNKSMIGFVQLYPIFSSTRMKRLWLLNDLFVEPSQRGKGISKLLIEQVQRFALESKSCGLILETAKKNSVGNQLYPATGFILDNDHNYYSWNC